MYMERKGLETVELMSRCESMVVSTASGTLLLSIFGSAYLPRGILNPRPASSTRSLEYRNRRVFGRTAYQR
jgi:hypothetical protein